MNKGIIEFAQIQLNRKGLNAGTPDGIIGEQTKDALDKIKGLPKDWATERKLVGFLQMKTSGDIPIDGILGFQSRSLIDYLMRQYKHNPNEFPRERDVEKFYGKVGCNQVMCQLPYPHKLAWDTSKTILRFSCHRIVHYSLERVLRNIFNMYGIERIRQLRMDVFGGCFNNRNKIGGNTPSLHSWGVAVDYNPLENQWNWRKDKAGFAKPEYDKWWKCWEEEGWTSLGRSKGFDWMHIQATRN